MKTPNLIAFILVTGCGASAKHSATSEQPSSSNGAPGNVLSNSLLVADANGLPTCTPANQGQLAYVKASSQFQACDSGSWSTINIVGPTGATGPAGPAGTSKIDSSIFCTGQLQNTSLWFVYEAVQMTSGDVFIDGNIRGNAYQISGVSYYSSQQVGYATASVRILYDVVGSQNAGFFSLSLNRSSLIVSIDYTDNDGNLNWTMTPDKCVSNRY